MLTKEEKQLLLTDLCARLPYRTYVHHKNCPDTKFKVIAVFDDGRIGVTENEIPLTPTSINECKPYLRSIHKLTKEELEELEFLTDSDYVDYCNEHHIDYRNLIPKGLALEAPERMYETE